MRACPALVPRWPGPESAGAGADGTRLATITGMLAAQPWHYWLAVGLVALGFLTVLAMVAGYLSKVTMPKYPKRNQRP